MWYSERKANASSGILIYERVFWLSFLDVLEAILNFVCMAFFFFGLSKLYFLFAAHWNYFVNMTDSLLRPLLFPRTIVIYILIKCLVNAAVCSW